MRCNHCQAEWTVSSAMSVSIKSCPFCGKPIVIEPAEKFSSMAEAIKAIIAHSGIDGLRDSKKALALFSDIAPQLRREKVMFSYFLQCNGNNILLDALTKPCSEQVVCRCKVAQQMMRDLLVNENVAYEACDAFLRAIGGTPLDNSKLMAQAAPTATCKDDTLDITSATEISASISATRTNSSCQESNEESILFSWDNIDHFVNNKITVTGQVSEYNMGGLVVIVQGIRVFIPASQSGVAKGQEMDKMIGQTIRMKIMEANRDRRRAIGSIRAVLKEERESAKDRIWAEIDIGKKYRGIVKSITSYGVFVDIGGADGFVHVSDLSWHRISTPMEVVQIDDEIEVYVLSFDTEKGRISLSCKTAEMNPWNQFMKEYTVGDIVNAKIVKIMAFGAFAEILPGVDGLIHIAHMSNQRISKPSDIVTEGQIVHVKILEINAETKRIALSMKDCN